MATPTPLRSLLVLHPTFEDWGGAEWFIHRILERLVEERGTRVRLLTHRFESPWGETPRYEVAEHRLGGYLTRPEDWERIAGEFAEQARPFELVWVHNHPATEWYARAARAASVPPAIWYCHEPPESLWSEDASGSSRRARPARGAITRLLSHGVRAPERISRALRDSLKRPPDLAALRASDVEAVGQFEKIQANSRYTAGRVKEIYRREAEVVYPIAEDLRELAPPPNGERERRVLWVGRLTEAKRPLLMLEGWKLARARQDAPEGFRLLMVGSGPLSPLIKNALAELDAPDCSLRSDLGRAELIRLMQGSRLLVHLARREPFGLVPLEAIACGCPVLAHAEGGVVETIALDSSSELRRIEEPEQLADALEDLLHAAARRRDESARTIFPSSFSTTHVINALTCSE